MFAFASLYVQIPGLYGNEGVLPARWQLRVSGKSVVEQLKDSPTLLWFGPLLGLDTAVHGAAESDRSSAQFNDSGCAGAQRLQSLPGALDALSVPLPGGPGLLILSVG
ncbi:hypothetical protein G5714_017571 [Onychostoma macrolepis]|uniref:Uncharacterized protein n=1 Tax=Onychostoma macrolepis TaxID=369639 RepID=A0A7J6C1K4_9TELE|nr:hypothetical protein G5714_017571 [Onychostoma macrolepis]